VPEIHCASTEGFDRRDPKMSLKNDLFLRTISDIKLKRTDTTLDLSQKACCTLLAIIIDEVGGQVELTKRAEEKKRKVEELVEETDICSFAVGATGR
jgi:hypothetical protein